MEILIILSKENLSSTHCIFEGILPLFVLVLKPHVLENETKSGSLAMRAQTIKVNEGIANKIMH